MTLRLDSELQLKGMLRKNPRLKVIQDIQSRHPRGEVKPPRPVMRESPADALLSEDAIQAKFFEWARDEAEYVPELKLLYSIPNGSHKSKAQRALFQRTGLKAGMPDLHLPVSRGGYLTLYIEFKTATGSLSASQKVVIEDLRAEGHLVGVCRSAVEAKNVVEAYLRLPDTGKMLSQYRESPTTKLS
jgi:hypothetical protein